MATNRTVLGAAGAGARVESGIFYTMAKKKKNREELPEGMSRRQAKLAARAAERAANERDPRPYAGLAAEAELVALQEFVPLPSHS